MGMNRDMMKKLQKMQDQMARANEELKSRTVEATAGGGAVKVVMSGGLKVESIEIDPEVVDPEDVEMLQDLLIAAINEGMTKVQALQADLMSGLMGGGGMGRMPF